MSFVLHPDINQAIRGQHPRQLQAQHRKKPLTMPWGTSGHFIPRALQLSYFEMKLNFNFGNVTCKRCQSLSSSAIHYSVHCTYTHETKWWRLETSWYVQPRWTERWLVWPIKLLQPHSPSQHHHQAMLKQYQHAKRCLAIKNAIYVYLSQQQTTGQDIIHTQRQHITTNASS